MVEEGELVKVGDYFVSFTVITMKQHKKMIEEMKHNIPIGNTSHHLSVTIKYVQTDGYRFMHNKIQTVFTFKPDRYPEADAFHYIKL